MDPILLAYLLPMLGGSDALGLQGKGLNNMQDIVALLMSPQFAMLTGSYDPMAASGGGQSAPPVSNTLAERYMMSGDPLIANVASGIVNGTFKTPVEAKNELKAAIANGETTSVTLADVDAIVDPLFDEVLSNEKAIAKWQTEQANGSSNDPFAKAGLPSMFEQYQAGTDQAGNFMSNLPGSVLPQDLAQFMSDSQGRLMNAQMAMDEYLKRNPDYVTPDRRSKAASDAVKLEGSAERAATPNPDRLTLDREKAQKLLELINAERSGNRPGSFVDVAQMERLLGSNGLSLDEFKSTWLDASYSDSTAKRNSNAEKRLVELFEALADRQGPSANVDKTAAEWSGRGAQYAKQVASSGDRMGDSAFKELAQSQKNVQRGQWQQEALAAFLREQGRTPLQDTLTQRVAQLKMLGL